MSCLLHRQEHIWNLIHSQVQCIPKNWKHLTSQMFDKHCSNWAYIFTYNRNTLKGSLIVYQNITGMKYYNGTKRSDPANITTTHAWECLQVSSYQHTNGRDHIKCVALCARKKLINGPSWNIDFYAQNWGCIEDIENMCLIMLNDISENKNLFWYIIFQTSYSELFNTWFWQWTYFHKFHAEYVRFQSGLSLTLLKCQLLMEKQYFSTFPQLIFNMLEN